MTTPAGHEDFDRESFDRAQRRHRRNARLRAVPAVLAAATMGIPFGVYLSPVLLALAIVAIALIVYLVAIAAFVVLAVVAGPLHDVLRGRAGR